MNFNLIEIDAWDRKDCFRHFISQASSTYSITVNIDITNLYHYVEIHDYRFYPVFTWVVSKAVNNHKEFKMGFNEEGKLGYYDQIEPDYAILDEETKDMTSLYTPFAESFSAFYMDMLEDMKAYKDDKIESTKPANFFIVSCLPWFSYTSFNVISHSNSPLLFPMVTWGKYFRQDNKIIIPLTLQIHHAVADGYHCSLFYSDVEQMVDRPETYIK